MNPFERSFQAVRLRLREAEAHFGRGAGAVGMVAVGKTHPLESLRQVAALGQCDFGENYLQEALPKIEALADLGLTWHFIGHIQSNKTAAIAAHFAWVHTVDREKIARRLNDQRPASLPPLNVCVEVNVSGEGTKSGVHPTALDSVLAAVACLPHLKLRGLMTLPRPQTDFERQRAAFRELAGLLARYRSSYGLDTLSMGTTSDLEAAIAEGATWVRIGTAIFGPREQMDKIAE